MRKSFWILFCFVALSGFGWGKKETASETKKSPVTTTVPATVRATTTTTLPPRSAGASQRAIPTVPSTTVPPAQPTGRLLSSGDPEARKATIERLARLRRALEQKRQPQAE